VKLIKLGDERPIDQVKVSGRVTGALYEAKRLREDVDKVIGALDEIVRAGKRVAE